MTADVITSGKTAVVTGAASGIGRAAALRFAAEGMNVVLADLPGERLAAAAAAVAEAGTGGADRILAVATDVSDADQVTALAAAARERFGVADVLMNNAATFVRAGALEPDATWRASLDVNFWGVLNGVRAFAPEMIASGRPGVIVNTGSKQGITNPPGNAAYNVGKAALKTYTEALQHELRETEGCAVTAHLLIPGWTTNGDRAHQPGAWLPGQVVDFMVLALARGDFYILCPDDEVTTEMDRKRIQWGAGDITENRPPLSRWHPDYKAAAAENTR